MERRSPSPRPIRSTIFATRSTPRTTGGTPTGVTATIVKEGTTGGRLVLTRDTSGADGITLTDGTGGLTRELGLVDSRSKPVSSALAAAAAALGLVVSPPPATMRVGNTVITVDLSVDSLTSIAAKINAAGGASHVESEPFGDQTRYRLVADGNVTAEAGDPNSQALIDALGMSAGLSGNVAQSVQTGVYTDASDGIATAATSLVGLKVDGNAVGLATGDAINIRGVRGDGTAVTIGLVVGASDTMQTLLDKINDATTGFGSGTRTATAAIGPDGRIRLTDSVGGSSRLSLSLGVTRADGTAGTLGATSIGVSGRSRELQQGKDAILRVDGQEYRRATNSITDAIAGTTLNLQQAEPGTAIDVSIERDVGAGVSAVQKLADAYNAIRSFFDEQRQTGSPLYADTLLRGVIDTFTAALRTEAPTNGTYNKLAIAGVALDRFGALKIDADKLKTAMADKPVEIETLFGFSGVGGAFVAAADRAVQFGVGTISVQLKNLNQTAIRLKNKETEAQKRLDFRREQLVAQFTNMEVAISRLNAQRSSLSAITSALQNSSS